MERIRRENNFTPTFTLYLSAIMVIFIISSSYATDNPVDKPMVPSGDDGIQVRRLPLFNSLPRRQARQEEETDSDTDAGSDPETNVPGNTANGVVPNPQNLQTNTYSNVGRIINGVLGGDVKPILAGGAGFIPPGDLRFTVDAILQNALAPTVQRIFTDVRETIALQLNNETTTSQPPPAANEITYVVVRDGGSVARVPQSAQGSGNQNQQPTNNNTGSGFRFPNPLKYIQDRLRGGGGGNSGGSGTGSTSERTSPLKAIQNRLQSLFFGGGGNSPGTNGNKNAEGGSSQSQSQSQIVQNIHYNNRFRQGVPVSSQSDGVPFSSTVNV